MQIKSIELVAKDPTGNVDIEKDRDVLSIEYVSPTGMVGSQPFEGVNMVRTVYSNGDIEVKKEFRVYKLIIYVFEKEDAGVSSFFCWQLAYGL